MKFLNISNHPSQKWGVKQREEAKKLGDIVDIPFPQIDPKSWKLAQSMSGEEIYDFARKFFRVEIWPLIKKSKNPFRWEAKRIQRACAPHTFHVMGEQSFCFALITLLKGHFCRAKVVVSITEEEEKTIKKAVFSFVKFREII